VVALIFGRRIAISPAAARADAVLLAAICLLCSGCPLGPSDGAEPPRGGEVKELVPAQPVRLLAPRFVMAGEQLTVTARGAHPDECATFDRFESAGWTRGNDVEVNAWSARPLGNCGGEGAPWESHLTVSGMPAGSRILRVGDEEARSIVLSASPAECAGLDRLEIAGVRMPPATHRYGSAVVQVEVVHPTPCHGPPIIRGEVDAGELRLIAESARCGPIGDLSSCPAWGLPMMVGYEMAPLLGEISVVTFGEEERLVRTVDFSQCLIEPLQVHSASGPGLVSYERPIEISVRGRLPSSCAAIEGVRWQALDGELTIEVDVRDCEGTCEGSADGGSEVEIEAAVTGVPPGRWRVRVGGVELARPLLVATPGACSEAQLPEDAVSAILATNGLYVDLSLRAARERDPIDVHVAGLLPDGCWATPRLEEILGAGGQGSGRIELQTRALHCDLGCDSSEDGEPIFELDPTSGGGWPPPGEGPPDDEPGDEEPVLSGVAGARAYVAGWSRPGGLPKGSWTLVVDGKAQGTITVE
jgi:hypothetical protein